MSTCPDRRPMGNLSGGPEGGEGTISGNRVLQESLSRPSPPHSGKAAGAADGPGPVLRARAGTAGAKLGVGKGGEVPGPGSGCGPGRAPEARGRGGRGVGARRAEVRGWRLGPTSGVSCSAAARPAPRPRAPPSGGGHGALAGPGFRARAPAARRLAAAP